MNLEEEITKVEKELEAELETNQDLKHLEDLSVRYIVGKTSKMATLTKLLATVDKSKKVEAGRQVNALKEKLTSLITTRRNQLLHQEDLGEITDVTTPPSKTKIGHLSPDTEVIRMMNKFFIYHGFSVAEGPEIESDLYNFEKTNLPKDHPARDLQDTIYIKGPEILLRTHTSSVETRILSTNKPPLRFVVPGVSYRNELLNQSNHAIFQQYQGVMVDKNVSMANLKGLLSEFAIYMYGQDVKVRFRTKYYPEVEPGMGMDVLCTFCKGDGCTFCKQRGWIELLGSGFVHRNLLTKCGLDYNEWTGFAFGMGLDRIILTKFGIDDIRNLHGGGLVYEDTF